MKLVLLCVAVTLVQGRPPQFEASNLPPCPADYNKLLDRCVREYSGRSDSSTKNTEHLSNNFQRNVISLTTKRNEREIGCSHPGNNTLAYRACCRGERVFPDVSGSIMSAACRTYKYSWRLLSCVSNFNLLNCHPSNRNTYERQQLLKWSTETLLYIYGDGFEGEMLNRQCAIRYANDKIQPDYAYSTVPNCNVASLPVTTLPYSCTFDVKYLKHVSLNEYGCILENQVNCMRDNSACMLETLRNICGRKVSQFYSKTLQIVQQQTEQKINMIKVKCNLVNRTLPAALQAEELKRVSSRILHSLAIKTNMYMMKSLPTQTSNCSFHRMYLRFERFWLQSFPEYSDYLKLAYLINLNQIPVDLFRSCCEPSSRLRRLGNFIGNLIEKCPPAGPLTFITDTIESQCALLRIADKTYCPIAQYLSLNIPKPGPCYEVEKIVDTDMWTYLSRKGMDICLHDLHKAGKKIIASKCNSQVSLAFEHTMVIRYGWDILYMNMHSKSWS